jgi:hypothetical protein
MRQQQGVVLQRKPLLEVLLPLLIRPVELLVLARCSLKLKMKRKMW